MVACCTAACCADQTCLAFQFNSSGGSDARSTRLNTPPPCIVGNQVVGCCSLFAEVPRRSRTVHDDAIDSSNTGNETAGQTADLLQQAAPYTVIGTSGRAPAPPPPPLPTKETECRLRELALEYAAHLQPKSSHRRSVYDALRLNQACGIKWEPHPPPNPTSPPAALAPQTAEAPQTVLWVATTGSDGAGGAGTEAKPFQTAFRAVQQVRMIREAVARECILTKERAPAPAGRATILFKPGTYYLHATLQLGPQDSNISFAAAPSLPAAGSDPEPVVFSGGLPLKPKWETPAAPAASGAGSLPFTFPPQVKVAHNVGSGRIRSSGIGFTTLYVNGKRRWRARRPNGNPERDLQPTNYIMPNNKTKWFQPGPLAAPAVLLAVDGGYVPRSLLRHFAAHSGSRKEDARKSDRENRRNAERKKIILCEPC